MVKNENFQCPSERGGPEDLKNHPTFVSKAIFGGVMASQNMVNFFLGHPVRSFASLTQPLLLSSHSAQPIYGILGAYYSTGKVEPNIIRLVLFLTAAGAGADIAISYTW